MTTARALGLTAKTAWQEAWANRRGFWTQAVIMVLNDLVWIVFWVIFFRRVGELRGWDLDRLLVLQAILTTAGGIVLGLLSNARHIGPLAANGGLDAALTLPTPTLLHVLVRRVEAVNIGDLVFGVVLFATFGNPTPARTAVFVFGVLCAVLILTGFLVLAGSLSFFAARNEAGELGFHAVVLFSSYPVDVFAGATRVFLYTVVPAGFITSAPTKLVGDWDPTWAAATLGVSIAFALAGWLTFTLGLRRYTSGSVWVSG